MWQCHGPSRVQRPHVLGFQPNYFSRVQHINKKVICLFIPRWSQHRFLIFNTFNWARAQFFKTSRVAKVKVHSAFLLGFSLCYVQPNNFHVGRGICCSIHEAQPFSNPTRVPESRIFHFGLTRLKHPAARVVLSIITLFIIELSLGPVCVPNPLAFGDFHLCR